MYIDAFRGKRVLELGSGLGFDGIRFASEGAAWTFADIVPDNLDVIRRIAGLKGLSGSVRFHSIDDDLSFAALPSDYDAIWVFGSIHHIPFEMARQEALGVLGHLKPGGRWMELVYPRERWLREGSLAFDAWGRVTDGERTPWVEWHDVEKVRRRLFPAPLRTVLDFEFCSHNYRWLDLQYVSDRSFRIADFDLTSLSRSVNLLGKPATLRAGARRQLRTSWSFVCPAGLFAPAAEIDLRSSIDALAGDGPGLPGVAVEIECRVERGAVGFGLRDGSGAYLPAAEAVVEGGPDSHQLALRAVGSGLPAKLVCRNLRADGRSAFTVSAAVLRVAN